jgi:hypothetical protein
MALRLYLSGGTSNVSPAASLGGAASQLFLGGVGPLLATWVGTPITGITLGDAVNVPLGAASIAYTPLGSMLEISFANGDWYPVLLGSDGVYTAQGNFGSYVTVYVATASLPVTQTYSTLSIAQVPNNLFDDVEVEQRLNGRAEYRCVYIKNEDTIDTNRVVVSLIQPALGSAEVAAEVITTPTHNGTMTTAEMELKALRHYSLEAPWLKTTRVGSQWRMSPMDGKTMWSATANEGVEVPQDSNGTTVSISRTIVDEVDSTNRLMSLAFSPTAEWDTIKAGKYVSFWIKRLINPNSGGYAVSDSIKLKITQTK